MSDKNIEAFRKKLVRLIKKHGIELTIYRDADDGDEYCFGDELDEFEISDLKSDGLKVKLL